MLRAWPELRFKGKLDMQRSRAQWVRAAFTAGKECTGRAQARLPRLLSPPSWKVVALARIPDLSWTFASRVSKWQSFNLGWWRWDVRCVLPRTETRTNVKANRIGANLGVQCQSCTIALKLAEPQLLQSLTSVPCLRYAFHFIDAIDPRLGCFDWGN